MKISMTDQTAAKVLGILDDAQPDPDIVAVRQQLHAGLNPKPGQPLSAEELNVALTAVLDREEQLTKLGNPTKHQADELVRLGVVIQKLELMRDRQERRESQAAQS